MRNLMTVLFLLTVIFNLARYRMDKDFLYLEGRFEGKDATFIGLSKEDVFPTAPSVVVEGQRWWICGVDVQGVGRFVWRPYWFVRATF